MATTNNSIHYHRIIAYLTILIVTAGVLAVFCGSAFALLRGLALNHYGAKVNATTGANYCVLLSPDTCQYGEESAAPGGFGAYSPTGVAVAPSGNIYIADKGNNRVQEITPSGEFVLMFGKSVNETTGGDVCAQTEIQAGVKCKAGVVGSEPDAFSSLESIAIDPTSGNVYVTEEGNNRVDEFTADGRFVLMIGKEVNETTHGNLCTQTEVKAGAKCKAAVRGTFNAAEHGALVIGGVGNQIAVGGPSDLIYAGSEHRVQEFKPDGAWVGEISLENVSSAFRVIVRGITVDQTSGDVYLIYSKFGGPAGIIYKFKAGGGEEAFPISPREPNARINIEGIAIGANGQLAIIEDEELSANQVWSGSLLDAANGKRIVEFEVLPNISLLDQGIPGLAFNPAGELYAAGRNRHEIVGYQFREGAELIPIASSCEETQVQETLVVMGCMLNGVVNPSNVSETVTWFQWNITPELEGSGAHETPMQPVPTSSTPAPINAPIEGLRPNQAFYYRLAAYDQNFKPPAPAITSETVSGKTQTVPPRIVGQPGISFIKTFSAVMFAQLNPENTNTEYYFEYGTPEALDKCASGIPKGNCPGVHATIPVVSDAYAKTGVTQEATGLQPSTTYKYRLTARNEKQEPAISDTGGPPSASGEFTTAALPIPQAITGPYTAVTPASAIITGAVNPDGQPATYAFEMGIDKGRDTQYTVIYSAQAGKGTTFTREELQVTGLQPATKYAYRISIQSAYTPQGQPLAGTSETFTTEGVPALLTPPPVPLQLPVPHFERQLVGPGKLATRCKRGLQRNEHGVCVKKKRKPPRKRAHHRK